jgi:hypothetical protein
LQLVTVPRAPQEISPFKSSVLHECYVGLEPTAQGICNLLTAQAVRTYKKGRDTSSFLVWITLGLSWVLPLVLGLGAWIFSLHLQAISNRWASLYVSLHFSVRLCLLTVESRKRQEMSSYVPIDSSDNLLFGIVKEEPETERRRETTSRN